MKSRNGFTLIEMVLVLAIILILSLAAYPRVAGYMESKKEQYRQNQEYMVNKALMQYYAMTGRYCTIAVSTHEDDINGDDKDEVLIEEPAAKEMFRELKSKTGASLSEGDYAYWSRDLPASSPGSVPLRKVYVSEK